MKYTIHDPNNPKILGDYLLNFFIEVNTRRIEELMKKDIEKNGNDDIMDVTERK